MRNRKSKPVFPIYLCAALWLLLWLICPGLMLKGWGLAAAVVLTISVYFILSIAMSSRRNHVRRR